MQIPHPSVAEIMGRRGTIELLWTWNMDTSVFINCLIFFRALKLGGTLSLVRLKQGHPKDCNQALDPGTGGVIVSMTESTEQLENEFARVAKLPRRSCLFASSKTSPKEST